MSLTRLAVTLSLATATGLLVHNVAKHGLQGAWNLVWKGDADADIRESLDALQELEIQLLDLCQVLALLEEGLDRAHLDSLDSATTASIVESWSTRMYASLNKDLQVVLGGLSASFDRLAAQVDAVIVPSNLRKDRYEMVRGKKRDLSRRIVIWMERVDYIVVYYKEGIDEAETLAMMRDYKINVSDE
jgi:hypothetical protein